ncbi:MAG TPA: PQQ-binding-like beta-propeller repeat protein [Caulobacteraceae bacterium]|jgi:alcohol dehydrogenase (cytochrome c)|nr:PQQ-binding-like beta-propeller repeat protein [Caulobacteraceae bacterium]
MKALLMHRTAGAALAAMLAGAATAQAPAPTPAPAPAAGGFPSVRNEDAVYRAALAKRAATLARLSPVTDAVLAKPADGDWLHWRRGYDGLGFSPLTQINPRSVGGLREAWAWSLPVSANEITPLVHDGVLFISSGARVQAIDGANGDLLWQYIRPLPPALNNGAAAILKNMAIYEDHLFVVTPDKHMLALDIHTGKPVWDHEIVGSEPGSPRVDGGALVARGKVMIGVTACVTYKGGCFIVGLDAKTGAEAWRFYSLARPGQPGGDTWNGAPLEERFGGSVWLSGTYDPELNLAYWGIGQTYDTGTLLTPRPGQSGVSNNDGLYTDSTVALDPDTGRLVWHYQHMNRDAWDYDWAFERSLATLTVKGQPRRVAITAGKLGIFDVLDRKTGQYLFSKDVGLQNLVKSIDPATGHKTIDPQFDPKGGESALICPHAGGARSWPSTAYNPSTHIVYVPLVESCMKFTRKIRTAAEIAAGGSDLGWVVQTRSDSDGNIGRVDAVDLATGKTVWSMRHRAPESAALLATAGGVVFEGSRDRMFRALDQATGRILWETRLAAQPSSYPITYSAGGRQYVAVVAGGGGADDITWPAMSPEIETPASGTTLQVFALGPR